MFEREHESTIVLMVDSVNVQFNIEDKDVFPIYFDDWRVVNANPELETRSNEVAHAVIR